MKEKVLIGIDGGGTKTEFILFSEMGTILSRMVLGGSNPNTCGKQDSCQVLMEGIDKLPAINNEVCGIFLGASGILSEQDGERLEAVLRKRYPSIKIWCRTDIVNVIASAGAEDMCIAAICGTGVIVYAYEHGMLKRLGGYGYLFDLGGRGYHIGRDAICTALRERDGIGKKSALTSMIKGKLGGTAWDCIPKIYQKGQSYI